MGVKRAASLAALFFKIMSKLSDFKLGVSVDLSSQGRFDRGNPFSSIKIIRLDF
jgi:hypothetical protein